MRTTQIFVAALVAAATVAAVIVATGGAMRGASSGTQTLTLIESANGSFSFIDNEPKSTRGFDSQHGPEISQGDIFVIANELFTKGKKHAGWLHAVCTATFAGADFNLARETCTGTFDLRGGTLALSGLANFRRRVIHIAIVGGTGAYEGASGQIDSANRDDGSSLDTVRFHKS
jgi:hypothetical protein